MVSLHGAKFGMRKSDSSQSFKNHTRWTDDENRRFLLLIKFSCQILLPTLLAQRFVMAAFHPRRCGQNLRKGGRKLVYQTVVRFSTRRPLEKGVRSKWCKKSYPSLPLKAHKLYSMKLIAGAPSLCYQGPELKVQRWGLASAKTNAEPSKARRCVQTRDQLEEKSESFPHFDFGRATPIWSFLPFLGQR